MCYQPSTILHIKVANVCFSIFFFCSISYIVVTPIRNSICFRNCSDILHCNPLQGKYRFFTGNSLCSISTLTCFGSVQGLKGTNFIEIQGNICILYRNIALDIYIHVYVLITGISLLFEKQQHRILEKQGKPCK